MASAYYSNTQHIDFESVLAMDDPGMVSMMWFSVDGLSELSEIPKDVVFGGWFIRVIRDSQGCGFRWMVYQSYQRFPRIDLPVDGLSELSEIPKDVVFDARSIVSMSGEPVSLSGKKSQMKIEYRLLCDIMAKSISVKAGSFNAITVEKFSMLTAVVYGVRMNWASVLFNILKKMVTPWSNQAKGFAVQISLLLENIPNLELGESSEFPASKILTEKTVHRYVSLNDKVGAEEAAGAPKPKAASKKRLAAVLGDETVVKKKTVENEFPVDQPAHEVAGETVFEEAAGESVYEPFSEPAVADIVNEDPSTADDVDVIIEKVLADTAHIRVDEEDLGVDASADEGQPAGTTAEKHWFDLSYEDLIAKWDAERKFVTPSDTDEETDAGKAAGTNVEVQTESFQPECFVEEPEDMEMSDGEQAVDEHIDADEAMSLEDILMTIPVDVPLPSAGVEISKITMGKVIKIPGVPVFLKSLLTIKGRKFLWRKTP
ncbi:hypothetical protein F511_43208 [Dorcoceras hygrometricum]|uniref:Dystroglycan-like n=1 Tax=Dorcoceras hygrometricum TaxID=472368 RepID=A0A2Z7DCS1_9LAMI|nr:hypothetical protein F511_43208 [Dorcoceras hygrometricum]